MRRSRQRAFRLAVRRRLTRMPFRSTPGCSTRRSISSPKIPTIISSPHNRSCPGWAFGVDPGSDCRMVQWHSYDNALWQFPTAPISPKFSSPREQHQFAQRRGNVDPAICAVARPKFHRCRRLRAPNASGRSDKCYSYCNTFTGFIVLPNGNIQLPNGTIINPTTGQIVGQAGASASSSPTSFVNPYDTTPGPHKSRRFLTDGIVNLGASFQRVDYENAGTAAQPDYINKTFSEDAAFWLGPVFYAYSNGRYNIRDTDPSAIAGSSLMPGNTSTAYRIVGGIGTRQFGLFRASAYFGHQGSGHIWICVLGG